MKNIIITGGSNGLGKALAEGLDPKTYKIAIIGTNEDALKAVSEESSVIYRVCDVSDWSEVSQAVESIHQELGGIDVLINNAGVAYGGPVDDARPEDIQHTFNVNVVGALFMIKAVVPYMKQQGSGLIIAINSQGGLYAKAERSLYAGSKWALTGVTKVLQAELAAFNIGVTGLYPGAMEQSMAKGGLRRPQDNSVAYKEMVDTVEFILSRGPSVVIPEIGVKHLLN